jgi:superkiller protein 3
MSALVKGKLKAARDAIGKKDWAAAQIAAEAALDFEPDNYNAYVRTCPSDFS